MMEFLIINLDPDTREELYSDIHPHVIEFLLLEAINLAGAEMLSNPDAMIEMSGDDCYHLNDPFLDMDLAIMAILNVLQEIDKEAGIDVTADDYDINEYYQWVSDKLMLMLGSITSATSVGNLITYHEKLKDPKFHQGMTIHGSHLGNVVTLSLTPKF